MKMKLLKSAPLSHQNEIEKIFKHEKKQLGHFPGLGPFIGKLDQIKKSLQFGEKEKFVPQKPNHTVHQNNIEEYIKILFSLNVHFDIPKNKVYQFSWKGSEKNDYFTNANFYYEIACMFYNYSVLYFNQGIQLMQSQEPKQIKNALQFFRTAMWGFQEVKKNVSSSASTGLLLPEFQSQYLECFYSLCQGLAYVCFYKLWKQKVQDSQPEVEATLHTSIINCFSKTLMTSNQMKGYQFENFNLMKQTVNNYRTFHLFMLYMYQYKNFQQKHDSDCSQGHIGKMIGYLQYMKQNKSQFKDALKFLNHPQSKNLMEKVDDYIKELKDLELKNNQVYKSEVPGINKLPMTEEFENTLNPVNQPQVYMKVQEITQACNNHYSQIYQQLRNEIQLNINQSRDKLNAIKQEVTRERNEFYKKHNINAILSQDKGSDDSAKILEEIKSINGGFYGYEKLIKILYDDGNENDQKAMQMKTIIEEDYKKDKNFEQTTGIKVIGIKESGNGLLQNFAKHGVTLTELRKRDKECIDKFNQQKDLLKKISEGTASQNFDNLKVNMKESDNFKQLILKHQLLRDIFELHLEPSHKKIIEEIETIDLLQTLYDVFVNRRQREQVLEEFNDKVGEKLQDYRNQVEMVRKGFQKMELIMQNIQKEFPDSFASMNYQQKFISDLNDLKLLYQSLLNNLELHDNLKKGGEVLYQIMGDYLMSKDTQKEEIMKQRTTWQGFNFNNFGNQGKF